MIVPECMPSYLNRARHVHSVLRLWTSYGQKTNFFRRFPWVLEPYRYHSLDEVQASLEDEMVVLQKRVLPASQLDIPAVIRSISLPSRPGIRLRHC
jgi:hypothetical protein